MQSVKVGIDWNNVGSVKVGIDWNNVGSVKLGIDLKNVGSDHNDMESDVQYLKWLK